MKRLFSAFSLTAMLLLGLTLTLAHEATAQTQITIPSDCTQVNFGGTTWPRTFSYYCGSDPNHTLENNAGTMQTAISQMHGNGIYAMEKAGVPFLLYHSPTQYMSDWPSMTQPGANDYGITIFNSQTNVPAFSAVFEQNANGIVNPNINNTSSYQASLSLDYMFGYVNNGGVFVLPQPNSSQTFSFYSADLTTDWSKFNGPLPCTASGIFANQKDPSHLNNSNHGYLCGSNGVGATLNSGYSGSNETVLQQIWPVPFKADNEILAEENADSSLMGQSNTNEIGVSTDYYFNPASMNLFLCTQEFLQSVVVNGTLPSQTHHSCTIPSTQSTATQLFDQSSSFPGLGYLFNALASTDSTASEVQTNLDKLGTFNGNVSNPPIQALLKSSNSYIYFFTHASNYVTTFNTANQPQVGTFDQGTGAANGATYPNGSGSNRVWYSIVSENGPNQFGTNVQAETQLASHELGHVVDYNSGQPSASTAFNTAMQNDWAFVDYLTPYGTTKANSTKRLPCGVANSYTGPLANVTDPSTSAPFCTGNTLEPKWDFGQSGSKYQLVSDILQDPTVNGSILLHKQAADKIGFNPQFSVSAGWVEWFAQAFSIIANYDTGGSGYGPVMNSVAANTTGYFGCTAGDGVHNPIQGYLLFVYSGKTLNLPTQCKSSSLPSWWGTGIN